MADKWPLLNGVYSNNANWNGGTKPVPGDIVYSDGKQIEIDEDIEVLELRTSNRGGGTNGGGFFVNAPNVTIIADLANQLSTILTLNSTASNTTIIGDWIQTPAAVTAQNSKVLSAISGALNIYGNVRGNINGSGSIEGLNLAGHSGTVDIYGNVYGGAGSSAAAGIRAGQNCLLTIHNDAVSSNVPCIMATGTIQIWGDLIQAGTGAVINSLNANTTLVIGGGIQHHISGNTPLTLHAEVRILTRSPLVESVISIPLEDLDGFSNFYTLDNSGFSLAQPPDVREGVVYANGNLMGTLKVPLPEQVSIGVPTDNTVGTAVLSADDVESALSGIRVVSDKLGSMIEDEEGNRFTSKALEQGPSGGGSGGGAAEISGANIVSLTVSHGDTPLESARVRVTKGAQSEIKLTNANGQVVFALDDGTWYVAITLTGYSSETKTLVVSGSTAVDYSVTRLAPTPVDPPWINALIQCYDASGSINAGAVVKISQIAPTTFSGIASGSDIREVIADSNGVCAVPVLPGGRYRIRYRDGLGHADVLVPQHAVDGFQLSSVIG